MVNIFTSKGFLASIIGDRDMNGHSYQDDLWIMQQIIILDLASQGPCVIVGRCANYILKDKANLLRVFIHADMESRAKRNVEQYG